MPLVDMARSPQDVKNEMKDWDGPCSVASSVEKYPWGLAVRLEEESLKKLGLLGELPPIGALVRLNAETRVTSVSSSEREDQNGGTKQSACVELQIVRMELPADDAAQRATQASRWYSKPAATSDDGD